MFPHSQKQVGLIAVFILLPLAATCMFGIACGLVFVVILIVLELAACSLVKASRKRFPWLITPDDFYPPIDQSSLEKFGEFGLDNELG